MKIRVHPGIASYIGSLVIRLLGVTWRVEWRNLENLEKARSLSKQGVVSFWHGRLLVIAYSHRKWGISVLASEPPDGDLMGRSVAWLGWGHVKGSSTRRGAAGFRELAAVLRKELDAGLTIDGPRGPRGLVQQGATELCRMTGSVVIPVTDSARPRKLLRTWDRFQIPGLFARVVIAYGEPFLVPADLDRQDRENYRLRLERTLHDLTAELDRNLGYEGPDVWPHENH
ncbi:MAG: lysophospholipid acyltransferase family protein [Candidatus Krumholzibacteria bacterium]|nr:lysophospholipid acyltransferase family protein [Candidatus Krumholzibacteria bacterium]